MAALLGDGTLTLSGDIGINIFGDGFTSGDVAAALAQIDENSHLVVYLNSGGGIAWEGSAIHALLTRRSGTTDIVVDGVAASAASLIAMAGETVTMSAGSMMMIHDPSVITIGDVQEHERSTEMLNALGTSYARVYAAKSGKSAEECRAIMKAERWYSPDDAVREGFADKTAETQAQPVAAFDYRVYAHAPKDLRARAQRKNWRLPDAKSPAVSAAHNSQRQEQSMTDKERADQLAAENAELKMRAEAAEAKVAKAEVNADTEELEQLRAEKADRENADAIMALEEAKGREGQAKALAEAGVKADKAKAILAAAPKAAAATDSSLANRQDVPDSLAAAGVGGAGASKSDAILADYRAVTGVKKSA